jgi:hypothetical protein
MRTLGKLVLLVAVVVAVSAGLYLGGKSLWGGSSGSVKEAHDKLVGEQLKKLTTAMDQTVALESDLANAIAKSEDPKWRGLAAGYAKLVLDNRKESQKLLADLSITLSAHKVNAAEVEEMRATLQALAAQEFKTPDKTRADLLRKYRK